MDKDPKAKKKGAKGVATAAKKASSSKYNDTMKKAKSTEARAKSNPKTERDSMIAKGSGQKFPVTSRKGAVYSNYGALLTGTPTNPSTLKGKKKPAAAKKMSK